MSHTLSNEIESRVRALKVLEKLGYAKIPREDAERKRGSRKKVLFAGELESFLGKQTYPYGSEYRFFSGGSIAVAIQAMQAQSTAGLCASNKAVYELICSGKSLEESLPDSTKQSFDLNYIDFDHPENNTFQVTDTFTVEFPGGKWICPAIVVLINGIPLAVIAWENSGATEGNVPASCFFQYIQLVVAVHPDKILYGTCGTLAKHFVSWREEGDGEDWQQGWCHKCSPDGLIKEQDRALVSLLHPERLLELIRDFIVYDGNAKKIARYKQYSAVKRCMKRILLQDGAGTRNGVIWHTQGSGKTLTMIMLTRIILREMRHARFVMVSDRPNLDQQIRDNFISTKRSLHRAKTGRGLFELLADEKNTVITVLTHKFEAAVKRNERNESADIFLFIDEGHRVQYGKLNASMNRLFPHAVKMVFTGTPLMKKVEKSGKTAVADAKDIYDTLGPLIDRYSIQEAIDDKVTVPVVYERRVIPQRVTSAWGSAHLKYMAVGLMGDERKDLEKRYRRFVDSFRGQRRLSMVAFDVREHFIHYVKPKRLKGLVVCSSRAAAVETFYLLKRLGGLNPAVIITPDTQTEGEDEENTIKSNEVIADFFRREVDPFYKNKYELYEEAMRVAFMAEDGDVDLLIVKEKMLADLDASVAAVLYADKPLRGHKLLQAIARINRACEDKDFGVLVDYMGIFSGLDTALALYSDEISGMSDFDSADIISAMVSVPEQQAMLVHSHQALWRIFDGVDKHEINVNVWQERLRECGIRERFCEKLAVFAKWADFLYSSYTLWEAVGSEQGETYRQDCGFFKNLKDTVFREDMRYDEPMQSRSFTSRLYESVSVYGERDSENDLPAMDGATENCREDRGKADYPELVRNDGQARALYDSINNGLKEALGKEPDEISRETLGRMALDVKRLIAGNVKRDWHDNVMVQRNIMKGLDDLLFDFIVEKGWTVSWDAMDMIMDEIMAAAKKVYQ